MTVLHGPLVADETDKAIFEQRAAARDRREGPRVGDFIDYSDGTVRRISYVWDGEYMPDGIARYQTTDGGSFFLGSDFMDYSGSLYPGVRASALRATGKTRPGSCWIFHHDYMTAHNGVDGEVACRVYTVSFPGTDPYQEDGR